MLSVVYAIIVCLSVCVCVSVTLRYCIKTAKWKITQICSSPIPYTSTDGNEIWRARATPP